MAHSASHSRGTTSWTDEFLDITHFQSTDNSRLEDSRIVRSLKRNPSSSGASVIKMPGPLSSPPCSTHSEAGADMLKNLLRTSTAVARNRNRNVNNNRREGEVKKCNEIDKKKNTGGKKVSCLLYTSPSPRDS